MMAFNLTRFWIELRENDPMLALLLLFAFGIGLLLLAILINTLSGGNRNEP